MKTRRILATILTVLLFLSGGFLVSCSACQENTLPPNLKSYQELLDQYKPSDADLEKSLSDFSADAYGAYRRAYYQLLLCDRYSIDISGATETFGVTVEIDNLKNEYNRIDTDTEFNKKKLLDGSYKDQWLQVGANSSQGIKVTIKSTSWDDTLYMTKTATDYAGKDKGSASDADTDGTIVVANKDGSKTQYTYNKDVFTVEVSYKATQGDGTSTISAADAKKISTGITGKTTYADLDAATQGLFKKYGGGGVLAYFEYAEPSMENIYW